MKHLKRINEGFEDNESEVDYLTTLKQQKTASDQYYRSVDAKQQRVSKEITGKHLPQLKDDIQKDRSFNQMVEERAELTDTVIQALIQCDLNKRGFENFKSDLKNLLSEYPLDKLPKRGHGVVPPGGNE